MIWFLAIVLVAEQNSCLVVDFSRIAVFGRIAGPVLRIVSTAQPAAIFSHQNLVFVRLPVVIFPRRLVLAFARLAQTAALPSALVFPAAQADSRQAAKLSARPFDLVLERPVYPCDSCWKRG